MNTHTIFERDLNGEMVSPSDPGYDELINAICCRIHHVA